MRPSSGCFGFLLFLPTPMFTFGGKMLLPFMITLVEILKHTS
jgi:hypothetical protein